MIVCTDSWHPCLIALKKGVYKISVISTFVVKVASDYVSVLVFFEFL